MAKISGYANLSEIKLFSSESTPSCALGTRIGGDGGCEFRYVRVDSGTPLVTGQVIQSLAYGTNWDALTLAANVAAGATIIKVTNTANAVTADQFKWGTATIDAGAGIGQTFTILSNTADASSGTITLLVAEPVRVALVTSTSKVTLKQSPCDGVIQAPITTASGTVVGVSVYPIPAGKYGWVQTRGVAAVLSDNVTAAIGSEMGVSLTVAGACSVNVAGTGQCNGVGRAMQAKNNGHYIPLDLTL